MMVRMAKGQAYLCYCSVVRRLCTGFNVLCPSLNKERGSECKYEEGMQGGQPSCTASGRGREDEQEANDTCVLPVLFTGCALG